MLRISTVDYFPGNVFRFFCFVLDILVVLWFHSVLAQFLLTVVSSPKNFCRESDCAKLLVWFRPEVSCLLLKFLKGRWAADNFSCRDRNCRTAMSEMLHEAKLGRSQIARKAEYKYWTISALAEILSAVKNSWLIINMLKTFLKNTRPYAC